MTFQSADLSYELARIATATREPVSHPAADRFAQVASHAFRYLYSLEDDDYWKPVAGAIWRARRDICAHPVPFARLSFDQAADLCSEYIAKARSSYPAELVSSVEACAEVLRQLAALPDDPLGRKVRELLEYATPGRAAVLVANADFLEIEQDQLPTARVLTERELAAAEPLEFVVVVGPSEWFRSSLLLAPRAESFAFAKYHWLRDRPNDDDLFAGGHLARVSRPIRDSGEITDTVRIEAAAAVEFAAAEPVDWVAVAERTASEEPAEDETQMVSALAVVLAGRCVTYLDEESSIDVVTFHPDGGVSVGEKDAKNIAPDDFIVLRGEDATGDYRERVADRLLGDRAEGLRGIQAGWKERLASRVHDLGWAEADRQLRASGLVSTNIAYRLSPGSFRTRTKQDFAIFMDFIGYRDRTDVIWSAMGQLLGAHRRAGHKIRTQLEAGLESTDLRSALQTGRLDIRLDEEGAGALTIVAVVETAPDRVQVPRHRLRELIQLGDL